jgi:hypothetical protein
VNLNRQLCFLSVRLGWQGHRCREITGQPPCHLDPNTVVSGIMGNGYADSPIRLRICLRFHRSNSTSCLIVLFGPSLLTEQPFHPIGLTLCQYGDNTSQSHSFFQPRRTRTTENALPDALLRIENPSQNEARAADRGLEFSGDSGIRSLYHHRLWEATGACKLGGAAFPRHSASPYVARVLGLSQ